MADINQVYEALQRAHAAGDTENAQKLADYIRSTQQPQTQLDPSQQETAGVGEALVGGTKRFLSSIGTGLSAPFITGEEAALEGIEREKNITERPGYNLDKVKDIFKKEGVLAATGEAVSQVPATIAEQSPILASIYGGFKLAKYVPGPAGVAARIVAPVLPIFFSMAGSNMQRKAEEDISNGRPVDVNELGAYSTAFAQTALDRMGLALSGVSKLLGVNFMQAGTDTAERIARQSMTEAISKGTAKFLGAEIPTEIGQQLLERYYAGLPLTDESAQKEYVETAFAVTLMGPIGSISGFKQRMDAQKITDVRKGDDEGSKAAIKSEGEQSGEEQLEAVENESENIQKRNELADISLNPKNMPRKEDVSPTEDEIAAEEQRKKMEEEGGELTNEQLEELQAQQAALLEQQTGVAVETGTKADEAKLKSSAKEALNKVNNYGSINSEGFFTQYTLIFKNQGKEAAEIFRKEGERLSGEKFKFTFNKDGEFVPKEDAEYEAAELERRKRQAEFDKELAQLKINQGIIRGIKKGRLNKNQTKEKKQEMIKFLEEENKELKAIIDARPKSPNKVEEKPEIPSGRVDFKKGQELPKVFEGKTRKEINKYMKDNNLSKDDFYVGEVKTVKTVPGKLTEEEKMEGKKVPKRVDKLQTDSLFISPRVNLNLGKNDNEAAEVVADYAINHERFTVDRQYKFDEKGSPEIMRFLKNTLGKEQYESISKNKKLRDEIGERYRIKARDITKQEDVPTTVNARARARIAAFDLAGRNGGLQELVYNEVQSLAQRLNTKIPQFLKTGAVFGSKANPFSNSNSANELIENNINEYIFEEGMDTADIKNYNKTIEELEEKLKKQKELSESEKTRLADAKKLKKEAEDRGKIRKEFYDSPILDDYLKRTNSDKSYIDSRVKTFKPPIVGAKVTSNMQRQAQTAEQNESNYQSNEASVMESGTQSDEEIKKENSKVEKQVEKTLNNIKSDLTGQGLSEETIDDILEEYVNYDNDILGPDFKLKTKGYNPVTNSEAKRILQKSSNASDALRNISPLIDKMLRVARDTTKPILHNDTNKPLTTSQRNQYIQQLELFKNLTARLATVPNMGDVNVKVVSEKEMLAMERKELKARGEPGIVLEGAALGRYLSPAQSERINLKGNNVFILGKLDSEESIKTLLHELSHAATVYGFNFITIEQAQQLRNIIDRARQVARQRGEKYYGLTNVQEFIAEAYSNNDFKDFLQSIPSVTQPRNALMRLIDDLLNILKSLIGTNMTIPPAQNSLLDDLLKTSDRLVTYGVAPTRLSPKQKIKIRRKIATIRANNLLKEGKSKQIIDELINPSERLALKEDTDVIPPAEKLTPAEHEALFMGTYQESKGRLSRLGATIKGFFTNGQDSITKVQQKFVDIAYPLKIKEEEMRKNGMLIIGEKGFNNFYEQITLMNGVSDNYMKALLPIMREYEKSLQKYTELYLEQNPNATADQARGYLQRLLMAQHEYERREIIHMLSVPLDAENKTIRYTKQDGKTVEKTPHQHREDLMNIITDSKAKIDKVELEQYKKQLLYLADPKNGYTDGKLGKRYAGKDPTKNNPVPVDIKDSTYDPTLFDYDTAVRYRNELDALKSNNPQLHEALVGVQKQMNVLQKGHEKTQEVPNGVKGILDLNQLGNFTPVQSRNIIDMYGFDYYIPLKGKYLKKDIDSSIEALVDDSGGGMLSTKFKDLPSAMEGSQKVPADPFTQVIVDASMAAARAGRIGFTTALHNTALREDKYFDEKEQKEKTGNILDAKVEGEFTFEQRHRNDPDIEKLLRKPNTFVHFKPDGSLVILSVKDKRLVAAIRGLPRQENLLLDWGNTVTGLIGQLHTRFNVKFAPLNFSRDAITNLYLTGSDLGMADMAGYVNHLAQGFTRGNLYHTGRLVGKYIRGDVNGARKYARDLDKKGNPYGLAMMDYLDEGGMVAITASLSNQSAFQQQMAAIGQSKFLKSRQGLYDLFDTYMGAFELATRVAVFQTRRDNYLAQNAYGIAKNKVPKNVMNAANETAAAYAKNLSNFEKMGYSGRQYGAWFMFFRASMTGAARASQSIAPAFISLETAKKSLSPVTLNNPERLAEFEKNYEVLRKRAATTLLIGFGIGYTLVALATLASEAADDEGSNKTLDDDFSRWTRYARMPVGFLTGNDDEVVQIPWGFGLGGIPAIGAQMYGLAFANENEKMDIVGNVVNIILDSFAPFPVSKMSPTEEPIMWFMDTAIPTMARPIFEYATNTNAFGSPITSLSTSRRYGSAYQTLGSTPPIFQDLAQAIVEGDFFGADALGIEAGEYDPDPNILYFFANNYADGAATLLSNFYSTYLTATGKKDFEAKFDTVLFNSFFSKYSDIDQRRFARTSDKFAELESKVNLFKNTNPLLYFEILQKNPKAETVIKLYNQAKAEANQIQAQINKIKRDATMDRKTKAVLLEPLEEYRKMLRRQMVNMIDQEIPEDI